MVINKYLAGLLTLAITVLTGWQVILPEGVSPIEGWQFGALVVGAAGTIFVPLAGGPWKSALKTGVALAAALFAAGTPLVLEGVWFWQDPQAGLVVGIAVLNALAVEVGVAVRIDSASAVVANPAVPNSTIEVVDPPAVRAVYEEGTAL